MSASHHNHAATATSVDIVSAGWWRGLPKTMQGAVLLARWDRPVGVWLLLWPALWGLWLGHGGVPPLSLMIIFILGAVLMRGAGCTINDLMDRRLDGAVARTATRPLPAGLISPQGAWAWLLIQLALAFTLLFFLPTAVAPWAMAALPLILLYPFMKRLTWWPQVWLGLTFNWGLWCGVASGVMTDATLMAALAFYSAAFFWTLGYDTIYAAQDADDDALVGVRSTARLFGRHARPMVMVCYMLAAAGWGVGLWLAQLMPLALPAIAIAVCLLGWQIFIWRGGAAQARRAFLMNAWVGAAVALSLFMGYLF